MSPGSGSTTFFPKRMTMGLDHGSFISVCAISAIHGWKRRQWYAHGFRFSTTVGWLFFKEAKTCCNIIWTWKHIFLSGSVTRQDFRRPIPNDLGFDKIAGFSCRLIINPTEFSLPITDVKTAVLRPQSRATNKTSKIKLDQKKKKHNLESFFGVSWDLISLRVYLLG